MQPIIQLYAQYTDHNFGRKGEVQEIADLNEAVQIAMDNRLPRFQTFEIASVEIDGETFIAEPKNHSADIYVGFDQIFSRDDVVRKHEHEIEGMMSAPSWAKANFSAHFQIRAPQGVVANLTEKDLSTRFISEGGQRGDFIELKDGDKVFNSQGQQLHPAPQVPDHGLDPNLGSCH